MRELIETQYTVITGIKGGERDSSQEGRRKVQVQRLRQRGDGNESWWRDSCLLRGGYGTAQKMKSGVACLKECEPKKQ